MAEPYDTVNGITAGAPLHWWRFSDASGGVTGEGSIASRDLGETSAAGLGTFNWTYQYEANPVGDGYGMLAGGQGGLIESADVWSGSVSQDFSMMAMWRSTTSSAHANSAWFGGYFNGNDVNYCRMMVTAYGIYYAIQDASSDDRIWRQENPPSGIDLFDQQPHTICVTNPTGTSGTLPTIYIDGIALTGVSIDYDVGTINDDHSPITDFSGDTAIGFRGGNNSGPVGDIVYYEWMGFDHHLSASEVLQIHEALGGNKVSNFQPKTIRRRGRRLFFDYAA